MFRDKKKILILSLLIIVITIIIIVIVSSLGNKKISYADLEEKLISATELYYNDNKKLLPKIDGDEVSITIKKLVEGQYIEQLDKIIENGDECQGKVVVKNVDGKYSYIPYVYCGSEYKTIELYNKILEDSDTVVEDKGLYSMNGEYLFRGEVDNNYLLVNENLWRILGLTSDNKIKIIYASIPKNSVYDDRYNSEKETNYGKNEYKVSRLYESLNDIVNDEKIFSTDFKAKLSKISACAGARSVDSENNTMEVECSKTVDNQYATLLTVSEYINASLDSACKSASNSECQNYNYLSKFDNGSSWWTITPDDKTTYNAYQISSSGEIKNVPCFILSDIRPVVYLSSDTIYKGGDGTIENPYVIFSNDISDNK